MSWRWKFSLFVVLILACSAVCDIYLHNPRGSNNRLDEQGRERNNANRMFDSQNNNRGGYNVGSLYYYEGSMLPIEWTNQHSCGGPNNHCELIVQYMCSDNLRDGATTTTIPDNPAQCDNYNCNTDLRYGMHEDYDYYANCKTRERNKGLFTADQNLNNRNTAKYTRQNPGGTRRGYECPEERDYYPYWHPTPWRDLAIMTNNVSRCDYYRKESENVKSRFHCVVPYMTKMKNANNRNFIVPNNEEDCLKWTYKDGNEEIKAEWKEVASHGIDPPICQEAEFSRDNHLGNGLGGYPNLFNWTIPSDAVGSKCAMRIRYNISTLEFNGWDDSTNASLNEVENNKGSFVDLYTRNGLADLDAARERGYVLENNPQLEIFKDLDLQLQLAVNTAQFGRTFQDRSHTMAVMKAPAEYQGKRIFNLNVRGKRGNIVQVYPAVEYDFVPNTLQMSSGDYVHFQWTGSNTNPKNNDGQGLAGTDRSNVVVQAERAYSEDSGQYWQGLEKLGHWGRSYPEKLSSTSLLGLDLKDKTSLALLSPGQFRGEMSELDDAGTYFDLGPRQVTQAGVTHYMCTRNNNFSNRSQKGKIIVSKNARTETKIGSMGGYVALPNQKAVISVEKDVLPTLTHIVVEEWPKDEGHKMIEDLGKTINAGQDYASDFVVIRPEQTLTNPGKSLNVSMKLNAGVASNVQIYRSNSAHFSSWEKIDADLTVGNTASFLVSKGGVYVARTVIRADVIAGAVVGSVLALILIIGVVIYFRRHPEKKEAIARKFRNAKRSTEGKI